MASDLADHRYRKAIEGTDKRTVREAIADHMIDVATSWEVMIIGKDGDGEPIRVASARDSVEAAKVIFGYDMGLPPKHERLIAPIEVDPSKPLLDIAMSVYRTRLTGGEMSDSELSEMVRVLLAAEREKALLFLKALGPKLQSLQNEKVLALLAEFEADPKKFVGLDEGSCPGPSDGDGGTLPKIELPSETSGDDEDEGGDGAS